MSPIPLQPNLHSGRIEYIPISDQDCDELLALLHHPIFNKYLCDNRDLERAFVEAMIRDRNALFAGKGIGLWLLKHRYEQSVPGFCGFYKNEVLEIVYVSHPDFQGKGLATECALRVIGYLQQGNQPEPFFAKIDLPNIASHKIARKIGMQEVCMEINSVTGGKMLVYQFNAKRSVDG